MYCKYSIYPSVINTSCQSCNHLKIEEQFVNFFRLQRTKKNNKIYTYSDHFGIFDQWANSPAV